MMILGKFVVKQEPVNVNWQIVWVFLPITNLFLGVFWAAYRVQKLRKVLLLFLILVVVSVFVFSDDGVDYYEESVNDPYYWISFWFNPLEGYFDNSIDFSIKLIWLVEAALWFTVFTYFIHRWSNQWNEKVSGMSNQDGT